MRAVLVAALFTSFSLSLHQPAARADEVVETIDGRKLRLGDDGRYEWLPAEAAQAIPGANAPPIGAEPSLADLVARPQDYLGRRLSLVATVKLLGGRALATDPQTPGIGLPVALDGLPDGDRARIVRDCGLDGCRVTLTGLARRNARGVFLDAKAIVDTE